MRWIRTPLGSKTGTAGYQQKFPRNLAGVIQPTLAGNTSGAPASHERFLDVKHNLSMASAPIENAAFRPRRPSVVSNKLYE
jgi:hypothetical protein